MTYAIIIAAMILAGLALRSAERELHDLRAERWHRKKYGIPFPTILAQMQFVDALYRRQFECVFLIGLMAACGGLLAFLLLQDLRIFAVQ
ncbi:hypothetical protein [Aureimonas ureilytica]|uniref:hypothetical protein n=1 Tax=Aureimonas ureilytica TaxID=401562 RepID=UPI000363EAD8|nr:hypothetical protein [Aureimonas ureilytica]